MPGISPARDRLPGFLFSTSSTPPMRDRSPELLLKTLLHPSLTTSHTYRTICLVIIVEEQVDG